VLAAMAERASVLRAATPATRGATGTTDYYPIVVGAIAELSQSSTKARRQVYERATRVLLGKLRASRPKLSRKQIRLEQRALEAAIQRVEAEARAAEARARPVAGHYADAEGASADRRPPSRLIRILVPAGLAIIAAGALTMYWLASNRLGSLSHPRAPLVTADVSAANAPDARSNDTGADARSETPGNIRPSTARPLGCDPLLAATDLAACASADRAHIEASPGHRSALPPWLSAYRAFNAAQRALGFGQASAPADATAAGVVAGSNARILTEGAKQGIKSGNLDRAVRDLTAAIRADPLYAEAYVARGQASFQLGETERAIGDLDEAIRLDPRNAVAIRARGMAQLYRGDEDAALADLSKAIQLAEADPARMPPLDLFYAHRNRAALSDKKQQYDREIYDLTAMIDAYWRDPLLAEALRTNYREAGAASLIGSIYRLRAHAQIHRGSPDAAVTDLSFALQLDQQHTVALLLERGHLQETLGRREPAILDFQRVLEFNPAHEEAKTALARLKAQASMN
jgi:tetratricopeptide (TPR) repeat protein